MAGVADEHAAAAETGPRRETARITPEPAGLDGTGGGGADRPGGDRGGAGGGRRRAGDPGGRAGEAGGAAETGTLNARPRSSPGPLQRAGLSQGSCGYAVDDLATSGSGKGSGWALAQATPAVERSSSGFARLGARSGEQRGDGAAFSPTLRDRRGITGEPAVIDGVKAVVIQPRQMLDANSNRALLHRQGGDYVCNPCAAGSSEAILMVGGDGLHGHLGGSSACRPRRAARPPKRKARATRLDAPWCDAMQQFGGRASHPDAMPRFGRSPSRSTHFALSWSPSVQTYTLAIADGVLFACLPDEADISAAITDATAMNYGFGLNLDIVRGATLTDAARSGGRGRLAGRVRQRAARRAGAPLSAMRSGRPR